MLPGDTISEVAEPVTLLMVQGVGGLAPVSKSAFWRAAPAGQGFGSEVEGLGGFLRIRSRDQPCQNSLIGTNSLP